MIDFADISIVVQGPVIGNIAGTNVNNNLTKSCLSNIRKLFPRSIVILSTWENQNLDGLSYDKLIINEDPGSILMGDLSLNCFRQITSSLNGLKTITTKYAIKVRSDILFKNSNFIDVFIKFQNYNYDNNFKIVDNRVVVLSTCNPNRNHKFPFTLSDWFFFGLTSDLIKIFEIPLIRNNLQIQNDFGEFVSVESPYSAEQYIMVSFIRKYKQISFSNKSDLNNDSITVSERYFANNFILLPAKLVKLDWLKFKRAAYSQEPILSNTGLYTFREYLKLLKKYADPRISINKYSIEDYLYKIIYNSRYYLGAKHPSLYNVLRNIINPITHYKLRKLKSQK